MTTKSYKTLTRSCRAVLAKPNKVIWASDLRRAGPDRPIYAQIVKRRGKKSQNGSGARKRCMRSRERKYRKPMEHARVTTHRGEIESPPRRRSSAAAADAN